MSEAMQEAGNEEDVESQIEKALSCPCVADVRAGPCGKSFDAAFTCFIRNQKNEDLAGNTHAP